MSFVSVVKALIDNSDFGVYERFMDVAKLEVDDLSELLKYAVFNNDNTEYIMDLVERGGVFTAYMFMHIIDEDYTNVSEFLFDNDHFTATEALLLYAIKNKCFTIAEHIMDSYLGDLNDVPSIIEQIIIHDNFTFYEKFMKTFDFTPEMITQSLGVSTNYKHRTEFIIDLLKCGGKFDEDCYETIVYNNPDDKVIEYIAENDLFTFTEKHLSMAITQKRLLIVSDLINSGVKVTKEILDLANEIDEPNIKNYVNSHYETKNEVHDETKTISVSNNIHIGSSEITLISGGKKIVITGTNIVVNLDQ